MMGVEKERILSYLENQVDVKTNALKALDVPIVSDFGKAELEKESMKVRHDIYELKRHIEVIKLL